MTSRSTEQIMNVLVARGIIIGDEFSGYHINPYLEMPRSLSFEDVAINQGMNKCHSRLEVDIRSEIARDLFLDVPLIAANMSAVTNADFCIELYKLGALGVMHRAWSNIHDYVNEVARVAEQCGVVAASIGVGSGDLALAGRLVHAGANVLVIDIAQGYSPAVIEMGRVIKQKFPSVKLIVGNTVNAEMMHAVDDFADAVKVGIAQGSVCETKNTAGCTVKQWSAVNSFKEASKKLGLPIISDGSIKEPADFTKAIAAGANSVMAGRIFARCPESAADLVEVDGEPRKLYFGMASREAQIRWRGGLKPGTCPEGKSTYLPLGESVSKLVERYSGALRSGITYAGASNIEEFQEVVKFVRL